MASTEKSPPIRVYVHLAHGKGAKQWEQQYHEGTLLGVNEIKPYGYYRASDHNCIVVYSVDAQENLIQKYFRGFLRVCLGFDFIHVFQNAKNVWNTDVIWTHTESQTLGVLFFFSLFPWHKRPRLIGQCIWFFDNWDDYSYLRKKFYSMLLAKLDVLTLLSPDNLRKCQELFPHLRAETVLFGINAEMIPYLPKEMHCPIRIVTVGNDLDRDWETIIAAFGNVDNFEVRIASTTIKQYLAARMKNINIQKITFNSELLDLYKWADVAVVALKHNLHASGITVIQEAVVHGIPVVCSNTGGLNAYFADNEIRYIPVQDSTEMRNAVINLSKNHELCRDMIQRARARMGEDGLSSQSYVLRHVQLSRELIFTSNPRNAENTL